MCRSSERDVSRGAGNFGRSASDPLGELCVCLQPKTHAIPDTDTPVSNRLINRSRSSLRFLITMLT